MATGKNLAEIHPRRCLGFGEFEGICENEPGTPWTPHWCPRCDELRKDHITNQLAQISQRMAARRAERG